MGPRYHLDLIRDAADQVIYEESANYSDFLAFLTVGLGMWAIAGLGVHFGADSLSFRKVLPALLFGGLCMCGFSLPYLIRSRFTLDRATQTLTIRRRLFGIGWTFRYRIEDIEEIYEGGGARGSDKKQLGIELTNARTKRLTLWAKQTSLSAQAAHLNQALARMREYAARQTGRVHKPMTEDEWSQHLTQNAGIDFRRGIKRTLYFLACFLATAAAEVPFLKGFPLHLYWRSLGTLLLLLWMGLAGALIFEAASSFNRWQYLRDLKKIDKEYGSEEP